MRQLAVVVTIVFATPGLSGACRARQNAPASQDMDAMDSTEQHATLAAQEAMGGPMPADPHMTLTPLRPGSVADSTRAAAIVAQMRAALGKYRDVRVAEADGFRQFLPGVPQPVYHFTNRRWALAEMLRYDPAKPTSLLYRKQPGGTFELVGAMYAAPGRASLDQLDARVPLSVARWHEHVNWCVPPEPPAVRSSRLRLGPLVAVMFFTVSGGPFGLEGLVGSVGPGVALLLLVATPLVYSVPETLLIGELASMLPVEGGYYQWVKRAFGRFWGFWNGWLSWTYSLLDMAISE